MHVNYWVFPKFITIKYNTRLLVMLSGKRPAVHRMDLFPGTHGRAPKALYSLSLCLVLLPKGRNSGCQVGFFKPFTSSHPEAAGQQEAGLTHAFPIQQGPGVALHCCKWSCWHLAQKQGWVFWVRSYPTQLVMAVAENEGQGWATPQGN